MPKSSPLRAFGLNPGVRRPFQGKSDTRRRRKMKDVARTLPRAPGVYFFYGAQDQLLYIGKAKCLRERVRSYFAETKSPRSPKLRRLLAEIERLDFRECGSELEALLLERRLIADLLPVLNWQHARYSVYPYLLLSDEDFPRLTVTKAEPVDSEPENDSDSRADVVLHPQSSWMPLETPPHLGSVPGIYLGPFTSAHVATATFEAVRALFPLRSCEGAIKVDVNGRGCFYKDIGRCAGPCVGAVTKSRYADICNELIQLLQTGQAPRLDAVRARMHDLAQTWEFEAAAVLKEQIAAIETLAVRLRRLERMRTQHDLAIVQPGLSEDCAAPASIVFLVRGGIVRRYLVVRDFEAECAALRSELRAVFDAPMPPSDYTAKTEIDEMMVLDRWLKVHGTELCCTWLGDRSSRQWIATAMRQLRAVAEQGESGAVVESTRELAA